MSGRVSRIWECWKTVPLLFWLMMIVSKFFFFCRLFLLIISIWTLNLWNWKFWKRVPMLFWINDDVKYFSCRSYLLIICTWTLNLWLSSMKYGALSPISCTSGKWVTCLPWIFIHFCAMLVKYNGLLCIYHLYLAALFLVLSLYWFLLQLLIEKSVMSFSENCYKQPTIPLCLYFYWNGLSILWYGSLKFLGFHYASWIYLHIRFHFIFW